MNAQQSLINPHANTETKPAEAPLAPVPTPGTEPPANPPAAPAQAPAAAMAMAKASGALAQYSEYLDYNRYNPICYTQAVFESLPAGVRMVPQVLQIPPRDLWTKDKASFLKAGDVMLSAVAINRIAKAFGVTLDRVTDEVIEVGGKAVLRIEYKATMLMPDGNVQTDIGGKEEPYTPGQQHSREKTDTKARRNALRRLLDIPVTMAEEDMKKPMVVWKAVYELGGDVDHIVHAIEAKKVAAIKMLYGSVDTQTGEIVDIRAEHSPASNQPVASPEPLTFEAAKAKARAASSLEDLTTLEKALNGVALTTEQRKTLGAVIISRRDELSEPAL